MGSDRTICVMAAAGEVGRLTVNALLALGCPGNSIVGCGRSPAKMTDLTHWGIQVRQADYNSLASMESAFLGVQTLILIPTKSPAAPRCLEYGNALAAAKTAGVKRIVFLSIQAATPLSQFEVAPFILFAECATRQSGMEWVIARMSLYSDPVAEWAPELARTGRLPYPVVNARIAYVSRADVAASLAALAMDPSWKGEVVQLTGPESVSMPAAAQAVSEVTGTPVHFETISEDRYRAICDAEKVPAEITAILVTMYRAAEAQEFSAVSNDVERITGKPAESFKSAISRLIAK